MHIHMKHSHEMCPGEALWENDVKGVSWLGTICHSLIPKENGTRNNQERDILELS